MSSETLRYARRVSARVKPDRVDEFLTAIRNQIYPNLKSKKGVRRIYLLSNPEARNEFVSLTLWNTKEDADNYEQEDDYKSNMERLNEYLESPATTTKFNVEYHEINEELPPPKVAIEKAKRSAASRKKGKRSVKSRRKNTKKR